MTPTGLAYMAHPVASYTLYHPQLKGKHTIKENLARAKRWLKALQDANPHAVVIAPWITNAEVYGQNPEDRAANLLRDCYVIGRCDSIVFVGGRMSEGMQIEAEAAEGYGMPMFDLTTWARSRQIGTCSKRR